MLVFIVKNNFNLLIVKHLFLSRFYLDTAILPTYYAARKF